MAASSQSRSGLLLAGVCLFGCSLTAATLDVVGVRLLRYMEPALDGSGVRVAVVEANENGTNQPPAFQVNPGSAIVNQPVSRFTYYSDAGQSSSYPNSVGTSSAHAEAVAAQFFGLPWGVATNIDHVDNHQAGYFFDTRVDVPTPPDPGAEVVNQSFIFTTGTNIALQMDIDSAYDDAAARHGTLYVSGLGNGGIVNPPSTCYNGIGVAAFKGSSSIGPTPDNGRCKPDLTAPASVTSFSTPLVAGAAAVLRQAGLRGDGGTDVAAASDARTIKALLLNGAVKPAGWTNGSTTPLDARHGAGVLNLFNAHTQLSGEKHAPVEQTTVARDDPHPPGTAPGNVASPRGWDSRVLSSTTSGDRINHYYVQLPPLSEAGGYTFTATLVWNRQENQSAINDLDLFLYEATTGDLVAESVSWVNNVEHLHGVGLPEGRYDLQVVKYGGNSGSGRITANETYALAWDFTPHASLALAVVDSTAVLTWPVYPAGGVLNAATNPGATFVWRPVATLPGLTNGMQRIQLPLNGVKTLWQLRPPE